MEERIIPLLQPLKPKDYHDTIIIFCTSTDGQRVDPPSPLKGVDGRKTNTLTPAPKTKRLPRHNNYILHLYGWSAWWSMACRAEKSSTSGGRENAQLEKQKFFKKFMKKRLKTPNKTLRPTECETFEKEDPKPEDIARPGILKIGKRSRDEDVEHLPMQGSTESPAKKFKLKFRETFEFWEGGSRMDAKLVISNNAKIEKNKELAAVMKLDGSRLSLGDNQI